MVGPDAPPRQALIGAGSNLGDRRAMLETAMAALRAHPGIAAVEASSFYETDPVGYTEQPLFLNLAIGVETTLTPEALMAVLVEIEQRHGRVRTVRWGPRWRPVSKQAGPMCVLRDSRLRRLPQDDVEG